MTNEENITKKYPHRFTVIIILIIIMGIIVIGSLIKIQIVNGKTYETKALRKSTGTIALSAPRGEIYDRYGRLLVGNKTCYNVVLYKAFLPSDKTNDILLTAIQNIDPVTLTFEDNIPISDDFNTYLTSEDEILNEKYEKAKNKIIKMLSADKNISAADLMDKIISKYSLKDYDKQTQRTLAALRYDMDAKGFSMKTTYVLATDVDMGVVTYIKENDAVLSGVSIETSTKREYSTDYCAHILGRTGYISDEETEEYIKKGYLLNETVGKDGIEKTMEDYLRGTAGSRTVEKLIDGSINVVNETAPKAGNNVYLTIDLQLQEVTENALASTIKKIAENGAKRYDRRAADANAGAAVVIDVNTAEVLSLASYPTYNLANFSTDFLSLNSDPQKPLYNRAISGTYAPGSTFKMCTALAGLKSGVIDPKTSVFCDGIYTKLGSQKFYCWYYTDYGKGHGRVNVTTALKGSCNEFFYEVGNLTGIDNLVKWAKRCGFGEKTGIELLNESAGVVAGPDYAEKIGMRWYPGNTVQAAIGQSYNLMSPLQIANYTATVVNGGTRRQCHIVKRVKDYGNENTIYKSQPTVLDELDISGTTYTAIINGMKAVVNEGGTAASVFRNYPIAVGGKSGTAQVAKGTATGVFVTFAPSDNPQIAIAVVVEHGGSGNNVAPITREILDAYFGLNSGVDYTTVEMDDLLP